MRAALALTVLALVAATSAGAAEIAGDARRWHMVELRFAGPTHAETDTSSNPFLDYRLHCTMTAPSGRIWNVAGFLDGDGSSGASGGHWACRFAPDETSTFDGDAPESHGFCASHTAASSISRPHSCGAASAPGCARSDPAFSLLASSRTAGVLGLQLPPRTTDAHRDTTAAALAAVRDHFLAHYPRAELYIVIFPATVEGEAMARRFEAMGIPYLHHPNLFDPLGDRWKLAPEELHASAAAYRLIANAIVADLSLD